MKHYIILFTLSIFFSLNIYSGELSLYTQSKLSKNNNSYLKGCSQYDEMCACYVHVSDVSALTSIEELGINVNRVICNIAVIRIPYPLIEEIANIDGVDRIEIGTPTFQTLNDARVDSRVDDVLNGVNIASPYTGKGVIVGIIDQGIQLDHINFYNSEGELRIKRLWNQSDTQGTPPDGFDYGSEYVTQSEIENIKYDTDNGTHGIHVAGIAAGGYKGCDYYGVATEADIVFVSYSGLTSDITDAISYIYDYAEEVGKPVVINISIGGFIGPRDGSSDFDVIADELQDDGKILVGAAGNGGSTKSHITKVLSSNNDKLKTFMPCSYSLYSYTSQNIDYVEIYGNSNSNLNVKLSLYDKTTNSYISQSSTVYSMFGMSTIFTLNQGIVGTIEVYSETVPGTNKPHILIVKSLTQASDDYAIELTIGGSKNTTIHAWSYRDTFDGYGIFTHTSGDSDYSVNEIGGTGNRIISVGSYVNKSYFGGATGSISSTSSKGPTADGRQKPDVTAPGEGVVSSFSNSSNIAQSSYYKPYLDQGIKFSLNDEIFYYGIMSGTSMSAPFVTGVVATWLQVRPTLSPEDVKDIIIKTSRSDDFTGDITKTGNIWGYGKIDAFAGIKECLVMNGIDGVEPISEKNILLNYDSIADKVRLLFARDMSNVSINIYDITGKIVLLQNVSKVISGDEYIVDTLNFAKGVYVIKIGGESVFATFKIVIS